MYKINSIKQNYINDLKELEDSNVIIKESFINIQKIMISVSENFLMHHTFSIDESIMLSKNEKIQLNSLGVSFLDCPY